MSLDQYPIRDDNSEIATLAESKFEQAIATARHFVVQQRDRNDYGTDVQIEASLSGSMTNFRVHIQLKGTEKHLNNDGSISISVPRTNLNYMLSQPNSVYVCFHAGTNQLLCRSAEDVFRDAEHRGEGWRSQATVTIRFFCNFDEAFQTRLHRQVVAQSKTSRDDRLAWVTSTPEEYPDRVARDVPAIVVPESQEKAFKVLSELYERHQDEVISKAFDQFANVLERNSSGLLYAYLSEINLAMRHVAFDRERVLEGIRFMEAMDERERPDFLYCLGNGYSAVEDVSKAKQLYRRAIELAKKESLDFLAAQCWKNLGTEIEKEGDLVEAQDCYKRALELAPQLMEAHMALAKIHRESGRLEAALKHLDQAVWAVDDVRPTLAARGRRVELHFCLGNSDRAFDDISALLPFADRQEWIMPWCGRLVFNYSRTNDSSVLRAIQFWNSFLRFRPKDAFARKERLLCMVYAKMHGIDSGRFAYQKFLDEITTYQADLPEEDAHMWDRAGHWAQADDDWVEAELQYRKAYNLDPSLYGYCLGTALNFLKRFDEALPVLLDQAQTHNPDAMSWFQVAIAQEGLNNLDECVKAYRCALELDPNYDLALFNLGGLLWNHRSKAEGITVWSDALTKFPSHPLSEKIRNQLPMFFDSVSEREDLGLR